MLRRLYSHVAEAIRVFLLIIIPPQQNCFELFRVVGRVVAIYTGTLANNDVATLDPACTSQKYLCHHKLVLKQKVLSIKY